MTKKVQLNRSQIYYQRNKETRKLAVSEYKKNNPEKTKRNIERINKKKKLNYEETTKKAKETMRLICGEGGFSITKFFQYKREKNKQDIELGDKEVVVKRNIYEEFDKIEDWKDRVDFYKSLSPEEKKEALGDHFNKNSHSGLRRTPIKKK